MKPILILFLLGSALSACNPIAPTITPTLLPTPTALPTPPTITPTTFIPTPTQQTLQNTPTLSLTAASPTPSATPDPTNWRSWPVIPIMTDHSKEIYRLGLSLGNNPRAFSKMGDCETDTDWFLTNFDKSEAYYNLGSYNEELSPVIEYFHGSYSRHSLAAQDGGSAATLLNPMWADPELCQSGETPLDCEVRTHHPAFALIAVGTNDTVRKDRFEGNMRRVIERLSELGVVPVLVTKADNLEGDDSINQTIAHLAVEYDLMVLNFWAAVQPLPGHGLLEDQAHLTWARNDFSDPNNLEKAWPVRNLTALQLFNMLRLSVVSIQR